jgi:hypothetical protein
MENITVRLAPGFDGIVSNANPSGGIKAGNNAAFGVQPQGYGVANRSAGRVHIGPARRPRLKTLSVWRYRGRGLGWQGPPHAIVRHIAS